MQTLKVVYHAVKKWVKNGLEKPLLRIIHFLGVTLGIWAKEPCYVVRIDGGISSQIAQYVIGLALYRAKEEKCKVLYDLTWFKECGMDLDNKFVRNFDLLKLFPDLEFEAVTPFLRRIYYNCFRYDGEWRNYKSIDVSELPAAPLYLDGYGYSISAKRLNQIYCKDSVLCLRNPKQILNRDSLVVYQQIVQVENSVAVQVRRGDLATAGFTSHPIPPEYYAEAIGMHHFENTVFFFFSDEPKWVQDEIIPHLGDDIIYRLVDINGSDRGYMDLYLCASCKHFISSQGSFGERAAMLGTKEGSILIMPQFRFQERFREAFPQLTIYTIDENLAIGES